MKKLFISMMFVLAPLCAMMAQDVVGKWKLEDGSAIVEVYRQGDVYNGKIVWLQHPTNGDGSPVVDALNPDSKLRSRRLIGLNMLSGLKKVSSAGFARLSILTNHCFEIIGSTAWWQR